MSGHPNSDPMIHPTAVVDEGASVGAGTKIWHFVHVSAGAQIGTDCVLGQNVFVAPGVHIGNGVRIQNNVSLYSGVTVEDEVFLGPSCVFTNVTHPRAAVSRRDEYSETTVRKGATIGANSTLVCGHDIGEFAFVGAGAVVTREVRPYALVVGNPAKQLGWVCSCGERLPSNPSETFQEVVCHRCAVPYRVSVEQIQRVERKK